jgi:quercetin dioxygenase-like cupin family protein
VTLIGLVAAQSQPPATPAKPAIKRTLLQKYDVPGTNYETVVAFIELGPNVTIGRHSHPGTETAYIVEGEFVLIVEGQPDRNLGRGDSSYVPAGVVHDGRSGPKGGKAVVINVLEKGKPPVVPAR